MAKPARNAHDAKGAVQTGGCARPTCHAVVLKQADWGCRLRTTYVYQFTTAALTGVSPTGIMVNSEALL